MELEFKTMFLDGGRSMITQKLGMELGAEGNGKNAALTSCFGYGHSGLAIP